MSRLQLILIVAAGIVAAIGFMVATIFVVGEFYA